MNLSPSIDYLMERAVAETAAAEFDEIKIEHFCMALLKLSELSFDIPELKNQPMPEEFVSEIKTLKTEIKKYVSDSKSARNKFRKLMGKGGGVAGKSRLSRSRELREVFSSAEKIASVEKAQVVRAVHFFKAIIATPTKNVSEIFNIGNKAPADGKVDDKKPGNMKISELNEKVSRLKSLLQSKVFGQDQAIQAFTEGIFNSEILAEADTRRKQPKAIFAFAGPPGVGKTYLAETGAIALELPYKRFDMSSYSNNSQIPDLCGWAKSFRGAKPGFLTDFVEKNPNCILLFDEIEKAHLDCIHLFLQILDAGVLEDKFTEKNVSLRDTIIIFTTNAGRQLYENKAGDPAVAYHRKTILDALATDVHQNTGRSFFPAAICSRLATGYPVMFNHLQISELERIAKAELGRVAELFESHYKIEIKNDEFLPTALILRESGLIDARTLKAQTEIFVKTEIFKLCRLFDIERVDEIFSKVKKISFVVEKETMTEDISAMFVPKEKQNVLFFGETGSRQLLGQFIPELNWFFAEDIEKAVVTISEGDIQFVILDPFPGGDKNNFSGTMKMFDNVPAASQSLKKTRELLKLIKEKLSGIPVYALSVKNGDDETIDDELLSNLSEEGVRGKITLQIPQGATDFKSAGSLKDSVLRLSGQLYREKMTLKLGKESKVLSFDTAPKIDGTKSTALLRIRNLHLTRAVSAMDIGQVIGDMEKPSTRFEDVIGAKSAKDELAFFVNFLKNPKIFSVQGLKPPKGVLLHGPPGTGKTMLARAMAGESDVAFISTVSSSFVTKWQGSGPEAVRSLFAKARKYAPSILFIDEIDAIGRSRSGGGNAHGEEMALNALLTEMDGFTSDPSRPVFVLAATNFSVEEGKGAMGVLDAALVRRFDRIILVDLPDRDDREIYLNKKLLGRKGSKVTEEMVKRIAGRSTGMSLANLETVIESAARNAAKKSIPIDDNLLDEAFEQMQHGDVKEWDPKYLERVARHEAGHTLLYCLSGRWPIYVTVVARGGHGGYMERSPEDMENPLRTKKNLIDDIRVSLGGRAAEAFFYKGEDGLSSGASGDLQNATAVARRMISQYGMDDGIGLIAMTTEEAAKGPMAIQVNQAVSVLLKKEFENTLDLLKQNSCKIDAIAKSLISKNRLTAEDLKAIMEG
ncbi:MAG: AAA family ATPase [Victivallales bacterium]